MLRDGTVLCRQRSKQDNAIESHQDVQVRPGTSQHLQAAVCSDLPTFYTPTTFKEGKQAFQGPQIDKEGSRIHIGKQMFVRSVVSLKGTLLNCILDSSSAGTWVHVPSPASMMCEVW